MQVIPQSLKDEVYLDIFGRLLKKSKIFSLNFSVEFLNTLALLLKERKYGPEEVIYHPNEKGTTLYFIIKGSVELYLPVKNPSDSEYPLVSSLKVTFFSVFFMKLTNLPLLIYPFWSFAYCFNLLTIERR